MLQLSAPPLPSFLAGGECTFEVGQSHMNRCQLGVFDLLIVTKGSLLIGENENCFQVEAGQSLILYPNRHHFPTGPCAKPTHFYWFHFTTSKDWHDLDDRLASQSCEVEMIRKRSLVSEQPFAIRLSKYCTILNWEGVERLCRQILSSVNESTFSGEWQRQTLFQQLLQELSEHEQLDQSLPSIAVAEKAAAFLRKHYDQKITYESLGEAIRFHPNHIARCMRSVFGCTPIEYVNRVRFEKAKLLLVSTDWSIERISERCGFSQLAYFSRYFKQQEGLTPNEFRKQYIGHVPKKLRSL